MNVPDTTAPRNQSTKVAQRWSLSFLAPLRSALRKAAEKPQTRKPSALTTQPQSRLRSPAVLIRSL